MSDSAAGPRTITRNTVLNLLGFGLPLVVAVFTVPHLDRILGTERYGLLLIAWMLLGYFSLFDLGMGRALTHLVADKLSSDVAQVPLLIRTALALTLILGIIGGAVLWLASPWIVHDILSGLSAGVLSDTERSFNVLAATVPVVVLTASLRGILEAKNRFDMVNCVRIPLGIATFAGPLVAIPFYPTLLAAILVLSAARIAALTAYFSLVLRTFPNLWRPHTSAIQGRGHPAANARFFDPSLIRPLAHFGGWMTVSNIVSPLMVYADRLVIGSVLTATAVAYYATPWEVVTKFLLIPAALSSVLFPAFSHLRQSGNVQIKNVFMPSVKVSAIVLFPLTLMTVAFARPALLAWMGPDYAVASALPMQILAIGVYFNGIAGIPFSLIQGIGRPDITAKLHLVELSLYGVVLLFFIQLWGIVGVATAWSLRTGLDLLLLTWVSRRFASLRRTDLIRFSTGLALSLTVLGLGFVPDTLVSQIIFVAIALVIGGRMSWRFLLEGHEREVILKYALLRRSVSPSVNPRNDHPGASQLHDFRSD